MGPPASAGSAAARTRAPIACGEAWAPTPSTSARTPGIRASIASSTTANGATVTIDDRADDGADRGAEGDNVGTGVESITGTDGDDTLTGVGAFNNTFAGGGGNDMLFAGEGDDFLAGGSGDDVMTGDEGSDRVTYRNAGTGYSTRDGVTVTEDGEANDGVPGERDDVGGRVGDVEYLYGGVGDDVLDLSGYGGGVGANPPAPDGVVVSGFDGNDTLTGTRGSDYLEGGNGDSDVLDCRGGEDIVVTGETLIDCP